LAKQLSGVPRAKAAQLENGSLALSFIDAQPKLIFDSDRAGARA
jgi:hypothetical protein